MLGVTGHVFDFKGKSRKFGKYRLFYKGKRFKFFNKKCDLFILHLLLNTKTARKWRFVITVFHFYFYFLYIY